MTGNDHDDGRFRGPRSLAANSSLRSRRTLAAAVIGSAVLLGGTVLLWRHDAAPAGTPALALPGPWVPPAAASAPVTVQPPRTSPASPARTSRPAAERSVSPSPARPSTTAPASSPPAGPNLSIGAGSDGSSRADGTRFGNVRDGNPGTFWSPSGPAGEVSIKWTSPTAVSRIVLREASGGGPITSWQLRNHDTGAVLAAGTDARAASFPSTRLGKLTLVVRTATGAPRIAEFETFAR